jgi:capsular polysaccharide biosynthesis protein
MRRHKILIGTVAALGLVAGVGYAFLNPPMITSSALVVLPQAAAQGSANNPDSPGGSSYIATQVVIASSDPVLLGALPKISPPASLAKLRVDVSAKSITTSIFSITANGTSAAQAEGTANAVAGSYVSYVSEPSNGRVQANILQPAIVATKTASAIRQYIYYGVLGLLGGILIGFVAAFAVSREDRRLRARDDIARSIGVPVLASLPVGHPTDAGAWARLLDNYRPAAVHAWQQRRLLNRLGIADDMPEDHLDVSGCSITVLSLSSDRKALALGPQFAAFAASQGIPTALIVGPQPDENITATLRAACGAISPSSSNRPGHLHVAVYSDLDMHGVSDAALTVLVAVVDSRVPLMPDMMPTTTTVLGVSAGKTTAEQLARVALSAVTAGREITGILVADPEPDDRTTGQVPHLRTLARHRLPTRLNGITTEIRR